MDRSMARNKRLRRRSSAQIRWSGGEVLAAARSLNARCIEQLAEVASAPYAGDAWGSVFGFQDLWKQLTTEACERAGRCPVLLLNVNLERADWWTSIREGHTVVHAGASSPLLAADRAAPLVREILTEARSAMRAQRGAARLVFGMSPFVSSVVADLSVADIDRIAVAYGRELRPRWDDRPVFWKRLLEAAIGTDARIIAKIHLHCVQLLGRDLQLAKG
jgi:hypothetical protein